MHSNSKDNSYQKYGLLHVALQDLRKSAFFAGNLLDQGWHFEPWETDWQSYLHQSAYVTSLVVSYCRPFTECRGWPKFPKKMLRVLTQEQKIFHQRLLDLRNDVYAHSDVSARKIKPIIFKNKPTATEVLPPMRFDKNDLVSIRELIGTINVEIQKELESLSLSVAEEKT
ncbi:hypothetical protein WNY51_07550 [Pseudocolwellia sp. AS88]|uniref:hypothetical protein n=1 Tax=Pseudocolwellia sp. AS88 TaxID=3063958 RepID=UPI0026F2F2F5|nr:hypothetical protein [Pseudocolwellia sp. AS88]MDO7086646.1 hypothetical protein [Pseudocolwellia sp. AS88]